MSLESEALEGHALAALHAAAGGAIEARLGLRCVHVGGALVSMAAGAPPSAVVVNRAMGLGLSGPETRETVEGIVALYREARIERYFVHLHPEAEPPAIRDWLREAGLEQARGWMKFARGPEAPPAAATDLTVRRVEPGDLPAFARILADAFDLGEDAVAWLETFVNAEGWRLYMSFDGDQPAGTGGLYVRDGIALCDMGATAPAFRRRGSQSALLGRRIADAIDMGCREIFTETGEAVEGDPQHSYKNILRMGFREEYVRENYAPSS